MNGFVLTIFMMEFIVCVGLMWLFIKLKVVDTALRAGEVRMIFDQNWLYLYTNRWYKYEYSHSSNFGDNNVSIMAQ